MNASGRRSARSPRLRADLVAAAAGLLGGAALMLVRYETRPDVPGPPGETVAGRGDDIEQDWLTAPYGAGTYVDTFVHRPVDALCSIGEGGMVVASPPMCPFESAPVGALPWALSAYRGTTRDENGEPLWLTCKLIDGIWKIRLIEVGPDRTPFTDDDTETGCKRLQMGWPLEREPWPGEKGWRPGRAGN